MPKLKDRTDEKCNCKYTPDGKRFGMCLPCAKLGFDGARTEWKRLVKVMKKMYKDRGEPHWFFIIEYLKLLDKGEI